MLLERKERVKFLKTWKEREANKNVPTKMSCQVEIYGNSVDTKFWILGWIEVYLINVIFSFI
jgi:hypothetical protein